MNSEFDRVGARIRAFRVKRHPAARHDIESLLPEARWRVISSMALHELVDFIKAGFRIEVRPLDFVPENFGTLGCITRFIRDQRALSPPPPAALASPPPRSLPKSECFPRCAGLFHWPGRRQRSPGERPRVAHPVGPWLGTAHDLRRSRWNPPGCIARA